MEEKREELSIGLGMSLAMNKKALENYGLLSYNQQKRLNDFVENCTSGYEARNKIKKIVTKLENNDISFMDDN